MGMLSTHLRPVGISRLKKRAMPYKFELITMNGEVILSPPIVPNNPRHGMDHPSIEREIVKTCRSIAKRDEDVKSWNVIHFSDVPTFQNLLADDMIEGLGNAIEKKYKVSMYKPQELITTHYAKVW
jgi:hypothetical protein